MIVKTPALLQTAPLGNPAEATGIFIIDKLLTKVLHTLSAVILLPTIIAQAQLSS